MNRRDLLRLTLGAGFGAFAHAGFSRPNARFRIGACDWSIGKTADVAAFEVARQIGLDGVQVSLNTAAKPQHLQQPAVQRAYLDAARQTGVAIGGLAIGALNDVPYKSDPQTEAWVSDSIDVAKALGVQAVLLAFFSKNDLRGDDKGKAEVVRRLRAVAPKAERAGVTLGIESYLSAAEHLDIMQRVGSPAVKVYYDFRNSTDAGYDIYKEIKELGKNNICELHIKENGKLLGSGTLDWPRIRRALDDIDYVGDGWMQLEWSMPNGADVVDAYRHNLTFTRNLFA